MHFIIPQFLLTDTAQTGDTSLHQACITLIKCARNSVPSVGPGAENAYAVRLDIKGINALTSIYRLIALNTAMAWFHRLVPAVLAVAITGTYGQSGLTAEQKQQFVDAHNELRSSVVPPATDMKIMVTYIRIHPEV